MHRYLLWGQLQLERPETTAGATCVIQSGDMRPRHVAAKGTSVKWRGPVRGRCDAEPAYELTTRPGASARVLVLPVGLFSAEPYNVIPVVWGSGWELNAHSLFP